MSDERLTVDVLLDELAELDRDAPVSVRFEGTPPMPVEGVEVTRGKNGATELTLVLPANPIDDAAVDGDITRTCELVVRGESVIFQVRFGMDLMRQCNADTPEKRLLALSMYFAEAKRRVDEVIHFGREAGRMAEEEDDS